MQSLSELGSEVAIGELASWVRSGCGSRTIMSELGVDSDVRVGIRRVRGRCGHWVSWGQVGVVIRGQVGVVIRCMYIVLGCSADVSAITIPLCRASSMLLGNSSTSWTTLSTCTSRAVVRGRPLGLSAAPSKCWTRRWRRERRRERRIGQCWGGRGVSG